MEAALSSAALHAAAWEWRCRHRFELEAAARFSRLADTLRAHDAPEQVIAMACKASADERRHADQCRDLVRYFGQDIDRDLTLTDHRVAPPGLSAREQLLYEVVAMSCVTETLSCALLGALVERARDDRVRATMRSILRDEIGHGRLGWAYLASQPAHAPQSFIAAHLPTMLAGTVSDELFQQRPPHPLEPSLAGLGALSRDERLRIFNRSMRTVVFPGLERFGIETAAAQEWLAGRNDASC